MSVRIEKSEDVYNIPTESHREILRRRYKQIDAPIRREARKFFAQRGLPFDRAALTAAVGCTIYLEDGDDLFKENEELVFDTTGIYHSFWNNTPSWEGVSEVEDLYFIVWLVNNDCAYTYVLPKRIAGIHPELLGWINQNLDKKAGTVDESSASCRADSWPDNAISADN